MIIIWATQILSTKIFSRHKKFQNHFFIFFSFQKSSLSKFLFEKKNNALISDQEYTYLKTLIPEAVGGIELLRRF